MESNNIEAEEEHAAEAVEHFDVYDAVKQQLKFRHKDAQICDNCKHYHASICERNRDFRFSVYEDYTCDGWEE